MAFNGLRQSESVREPRRRTALVPFHLPPPELNVPPHRGTVSSDWAREIERMTTPGGEQQNDAEAPIMSASAFGAPERQSATPPSRKSSDENPDRTSFGFYKWKHASDSQLHAKARMQRDQNAPPVPALPHDPPMIVMTAPTTEEIPVQEKRKSRFPLFPRPKSPGPGAEPRKERKPSPMRRATSDRRKSIFGSLRNLRDGPRGSLDAINALDRDAHDLDFNDLPRQMDSPLALSLAPPFDDGTGTRVHSQNQQGQLRSAVGPTHLTNHPLERPNLNHSRSWIPGRRKNRQSLFPLPVKIPPPQLPTTAPTTPRASISGPSTGSPHRSPRDSPLGHSLQRTSTADGFDHHQHIHPPLPSSPHAVLVASSITFAGPEVVLDRTDSTSALSNKSAPAWVPPGLSRGRSGTMSSLSHHNQDVPIPPPTPPTLGGSGRNSISTAGRSSFSNLLNLGHRLRPGSDPYPPHQGSPHINGGPSSQSNSFQLSREAIRITLPERIEGESAGRYLERVEETVHRSQIPAVLSRHNDEFFSAVTRSFMRKFLFYGDPLDMSIRKLLMDVDLPKETQQIDRFLQSFADRYHECNPGIFISAEKAYFIAFSILILQTDAFNKNNKRKMTKPDYLKNSSIEGVSADVLSCFYDNIVYTPFIRVEDDFEPKHPSKRTKKILTKHGVADPSIKKPMKEPLDPYALILDGRLDILRPPIKDVMLIEDPYNYLGTASSLDVKNLNKHSKCGVLQIESLRSRPDAFLTPQTINNPNDARPGLIDLPVEKVGVLLRKDTKKKTARSPWQEWGAILTGSGLCFFKNAGWVKNLMHQYDTHLKHGHGGGSIIFRPPIQVFKPDYFIPTENGVALHDSSYKRHKHAFVFITQSGSEEVFLADNEFDLNDWLARINRQASYRTAGIRPRGLVGGNYEGQRQRAVRRLQSSNYTQTVQTPTGEVTIQSGNIDFLLAQQISTARREAMARRIEDLEDQLGTAIRNLDGQLRDLRHLLVLAPIQQKSRELLVHAAGRMSAQLKWIRIEIWRMKCHRDILALDLDDENKLAGNLLRSPGMSPTQLPPVPSAPTDKLSRVGGTLHLAPPTGTSASTEADGVRLPASSPVANRPDTKRTNSSQGTEDSHEMYGTPLGNSPPSSPILPHFLLGSSSGGLSDAGGPLPSFQCPTWLQTRPAECTSSASSITQRTPPQTPQEMDDEKTPAKPVPFPSPLDGRPLTASDSEPDSPTPGPITSSPESRTASTKAHSSRHSLHRTLRDVQKSPMGVGNHHRGRKGKESGSSTVGSESGVGVGMVVGGVSDEVDKLARAQGSFSVHGKKASVVTFGPEWAAMSPLRKEAQGQGKRESSVSILTAEIAVADGDGDGDAKAPRVVRTASVSSATSSRSAGRVRTGSRSTAARPRRASNATADSGLKSSNAAAHAANRHAPILGDERREQRRGSNGGDDGGEDVGLHVDEGSRLNAVAGAKAQAVEV